MAKFTDQNGLEWTVRFSTPTLLKISKRMGLTLASIMKLDVGIHDLIEALPIVLAEQLRERKISGEEFLERLPPSMLATDVWHAAQEAMLEAFPQAKRVIAGGAGKVPFVNGEPTIS